MGLQDFYAPAADVATSLATSAINIREATKGRKFIRERGDSKHQREVADLRKAGLNPILSATKGMGGAPASGPTAQAQGSQPGGTYNQSRLLKSQIGVNETTSAKQIQEAHTSQALKGVHNATSALTRSKIPKSAITSQFFKEAGDVTIPAIKKTGGFIKRAYDYLKKNKSKTRKQMREEKTNKYYKPKSKKTNSQKRRKPTQ